MTVLPTIAVVVLVISALLGIVQVARGPDDASRAVCGDLIFFCAIAIFAVTGILRSTSVLFDAVLLATLSGILATAALARMLTRGHR
ncbi:monovalent cation/H+ antiporter complex subunit F [Nocardioides sp.]|uniref:monovalent cation/H+ antiporter complex subunit F n=1 Tax=Nocardioides sp. TaxID=35761 RepID=UPI002B2720B8|nr:monovalent cation/H+ antiporter complex subunit F [Nocardioides sp.]